MFKNLASALFLTERDASLDDNAPKVPGRIITTLPKAKEVRGLVEKCITIAKKSLAHAEAAEQYATQAERGSDEYKKWRQSDNWRKWAEHRAPVVTARRRVVQLIGNKEAAAVLFDVIAQRYVDRPGGYTRVLKLATPRLGDAGKRAILELVGRNDKATRKATKPSFEAPKDDSSTDASTSNDDAAEPVADTADEANTETAPAAS